MYKVKITAIRKANYTDLSNIYENKIDNPCDIQEGQTFVCENGIKPTGLCESAWQTLQPFVVELANGGGNFFDNWMKNPKSAMLSCNDGFRPVSFLVETFE